MNKILKVIIIITASFIALLTLIILLLSILFPREFIRKELEKAGITYLKTEFTVDSLDFSVFTGIEINGVKIANKEKFWKNKNILNINKIELKYSLLRLLKKEIYIKACVLNGGEVNLEKNKKSANWDYFINIFNQNAKKEKITPAKTKTADDKKKFDKKTFPLEIRLKKAGFENLNISYIDSSILKDVLTAKINNTDILVKNLALKENKPFDLLAKLHISADSPEVFKFAGNISANGKLKLFNEKNEFEINGPIDIGIEKISLFASFFKNASSFIFESILSNMLGAEVKTSLNDKNKTLKEVDNYFNGASSELRNGIDKELEKANDLLKKKDEIINYKNNVLKSYNEEVTKSVSTLDDKISNIDKKINPILDAAQRIPFIDNYLNISKYRDKVNSYKNEALQKKSELVKKTNATLKNEIDSKTGFIDKMKIPLKTDYEKELNKTIGMYKSEITKNINKINIDSLLKGFLPDLSFLDKEFSVNSIKTRYLLNRSENKGKDINFNSDYLKLTGEFLEKDKYIDFTGNFIFDIEKLKFDLLPVKELSVKLNAAGPFDHLKYKIVDAPKFEMDKSKIAAIVNDTIKKYLGKYYDVGMLNRSVLQKFSMNDVNSDKIKGILSEIKSKKLASFQNEKEALGTEIESGAESILSELKSKVPGL